jgi:hypothetical protein
MASITLQRPAPGRLTAALAAGLGWGLVLTAGLTATDWFLGGMICLRSVAETLAAGFALGLATMTPMVLFSRRTQP